MSEQRTGDRLGDATRPGLAASITRAASTQTYYTIRLLVDRPRVEDAFRAYAYFRWLDDILDADTPPRSASGSGDRLERTRFLDRQKSLMEAALRGDRPDDVNAHEMMLVHLARGTAPGDGLETYLRHMMRVMDFDVRRRGEIVSAAELDDYTRSLAIAVTEALQHFIGNATESPRDGTRYLAVTGAHILHMLRDTFADVRAGYFNVPREVLDGHSFGPHEVHGDPYRAWVRDRVNVASVCLDAGRTYFARVRNARHRLAGLAYIGRFEWLIGTLERDDYRIRADYPKRTAASTAMRTGWPSLLAMTGIHPSGEAAIRHRPAGR
jgi:hypothetical protein